MLPRKGRAWFLVAATVVTAVLGLLLVLQVPTVQRQPHWMLQIFDRKMLGSGLLAAVAFALPGCVQLVVGVPADATNASIVKRLMLLVFFGVALQNALARAEHRGWDGMGENMVCAGHGAFAESAAVLHAPWAVLTNYEPIAEKQAYLLSKPPGQLLFYMATAAVADAVVPDAWVRPDTVVKCPDADLLVRERHWRLAQLAALVFPIFSMLTLLPLTYLAVSLLNRQLALWPAFLYLLTPPVQLVTLHLDQTLYPLMVVSVWALAVRAVREPQRPWPWWAAAGAVAWIGLFVSFSILPSFLMAGAFSWAALPPARRARGWIVLVCGALAASLAFAALTVLMANASGYKPWHAFQTALAYHHRWENWDESKRWVAMRLNLIEYAYWLGPPLVFAFLWRAGVEVLHLVRRRDLRLGASLLIVIVMTAIFGTTIGEVSRLWLFLVPAIALVAAQQLGAIMGERPVLLMKSVAALQFAWMFCLKALQDFR